MITQTALRFLAAIIVANSASPASGESHRPGGDKGAKRQGVPHHRHSAPNDYDTSGMMPEAEFHLDPNSPEGTGGGSPGYNERL